MPVKIPKTIEKVSLLAIKVSKDKNKVEFLKENWEIATNILKSVFYNKYRKRTIKDSLLLRNLKQATITEEITFRYERCRSLLILILKNNYRKKSKG